MRRLPGSRDEPLKSRFMQAVAARSGLLRWYSEEKTWRKPVCRRAAGFKAAATARAGTRRLKDEGSSAEAPSAQWLRGFDSGSSWGSAAEGGSHPRGAA